MKKSKLFSVYLNINLHEKLSEEAKNQSISFSSLLNSVIITHLQELQEQNRQNYEELYKETLHKVDILTAKLEVYESLNLKLQGKKEIRRSENQREEDQKIRRSEDTEDQKIRKSEDQGEKELLILPTLPSGTELSILPLTNSEGRSFCPLCKQYHGYGLQYHEPTKQSVCYTCYNNLNNEQKIRRSEDQ